MEVLLNVTISLIYEKQNYLQKLTISTILLYIVLYVIIRNKVYGLQNEERPLWKYMHGEL